MSLRKIIRQKNFIKVLEAHSGLTGLIVEKTQFDAAWLGSLSDSLMKGVPDAEIVDITSKLETIRHIRRTTTKPLLIDCDSGGFREVFHFTVRSLEDAGVSAIVIEDKIGSKKNSLSGLHQEQEDVDKFANKIMVGKAAQQTDLMIFARIESLILGKPMLEAVNRAEEYIKAGADGIMIHSKKENTAEVVEFCQYYNNLSNRMPLLVIPTTFCGTTDTEFKKLGINIVVYANQLLRSAYKTMMKTALSILENDRAMECEKNCITITETLELINEPI